MRDFPGQTNDLEALVPSVLPQRRTNVFFRHSAAGAIKYSPVDTSPLLSNITTPKVPVYLISVLK